MRGTLKRQENYCPSLAWGPALVKGELKNAPPGTYIGFRFLLSLSTIQASRLSRPASVFASK